MRQFRNALAAVMVVLVPALLSLSALPPPAPTTYRYFAFGSNMLPDVMERLRGITSYNAPAAVLPNYRLALTIGRRDGPCAAAAVPSPGSVMHGVCYELSATAFARVGMTEGVPWAYRWERCTIVPYTGDGRHAGQWALEDAAATTTTSSSLSVMEAYTLVKNSILMPHSSDDNGGGSASYLQLLRRGAQHWKLDRDYQIGLSRLKVARNRWGRPIIGSEGRLLQMARLTSNLPRPSWPVC